MIVRFWFALCLTFVAGASDASTAEKLATQAELAQAQQQVQKIENALAVHQGTLQTRFDANDKRISDFGALATMLGTHSSWVGTLVAMTSIGIVVLVFVAGLVTFLSATARAKSEAREAALQWFEEKSAELQKAILKSKEEAELVRQEFTMLKEDVGNHALTTKNAMTFSAHQVMAYAESLVQGGATSDPQTETSAAAAVQQFSQELKSKAESTYSAKDHYIRGVALFTSGKVQSAVDAFDEAIKLGATEKPTDQATYLFAKGHALGRLSKHEEAIAVYDVIDTRYGEDEAPGMRKLVAKALFHKAIALSGQGKPEEAIAVYDAIDARYPDGEARMREQVGKALFNKAVALSGQGKLEEAIALYDAIDARYGKDQARGIRELVARALVNKGIALNGRGKPKEAIAVYDAIDARYGKDKAPDMGKLVAVALVNKGRALNGQGKSEEVIAVYDAIDARYGQDEAPGIREQVAQALVNKGIALNGRGKPKEAIAVYDAIDARYGKDEDPAMAEVVALALVNKGRALNGQGRSEEVIA